MAEQRLDQVPAALRTMHLSLIAVWLGTARSAPSSTAA
jgi:hypothetical protein